MEGSKKWPIELRERTNVELVSLFRFPHLKFFFDWSICSRVRCNLDVFLIAANAVISRSFEVISSIRYASILNFNTVIEMPA